MPDRTYRVLAQHPSPLRESNTDEYSDLGIHPGHDAKAAIETALAVCGLPKDVTLCIGIPASNWNEHDVAPDPRPQFKVTPRREASVSGPSE
jgi:hypothetical protein